jgi:hypothetical protein
VNGILAIFDEEAEYANRLMDYIKRKQVKPLQVRVFTNSSSLKEFAGQNPIHILLLNENLLVEEYKQDTIKNICLLAETTNPPGDNRYPFIYKYQSADCILKELFAYFPLTKNPERANNYSEGNIKLICVCSLGEEVLRQLFSYSLAKQYSTLRKTLYINFNALQVISRLSGDRTDNDLSEFIYYLKQNNPNLISKMEDSITAKDTLNYMEGVSYGPDLFELTEEDVAVWLKALMINTEYDVILFDVGCYFQAALELLRNSSQVLWLMGDSNWEQLKYDAFHEQLEWSGNREILQKITVVPISNEENNQFCNICPDNFENETANCRITAKYIMES